MLAAGLGKELLTTGLGCETATIAGLLRAMLISAGLANDGAGLANDGAGLLSELVAGLLS